MSDQERESSKPAGDSPDPKPEDGHISFIQRLERHFGQDIDPDINLQEEDEQDSSGGTLGLVQKLSDQVDVAARYEIKREIARGGMGTILRVWDDDLRRNLAMKVMHSRARLEDGSGLTEADQERLSRFLEEAQITSQLDHPGIVPVHDLGVDDGGRCYFTMRLVRGVELKEVLEKVRGETEGWTQTKALGLILKVCEAMAFAHSKGVVHRDLKPANIMVGRFGETYVMDWGLARVLGRRDSHDVRLRPKPDDISAMSLVRSVRKDDNDANPDSPLVTMDGDVVGTPSYMAPEQAQGKLEEIGPRSDVYSLGCILYYMLTGRAPYVKPGERVSPHTVLGRVLEHPPEPVTKYAKDEPAELVAICQKAMARDADKRYGSMLEVADDIQAYLEDRVVGAYEGGSVAEFRKWVSRNRGVAAGIAGMLLLSVVSAFGFAFQKQSRFAALEKKDAETTAAKNRAEENLGLANEAKAKAEESAALAEERRLEADTSAQEAKESARSANLSTYLANILAANYSLALNDVVEARERLQFDESFSLFKGWEYDHLRKRANPALYEINDFSVVDDVAVGPDGEWFAALSRTGEVRFYDVVTRNPRALAIKDLNLQAFLKLRMDISSDGSRLALVGSDSEFNVFDTVTGRRELLLPPEGIEGHGARVGTVAFSPNGVYLASGSDNGSIILWDATGRRIIVYLGHKDRITDLAWNPASTHLASTSADGTVHIWNVLLPVGLPEHVLRGHQGAVNRVVWDGTGRRIFSAGADATIHEWDVDAGRQVATLSGHEKPILDLAFDPQSGRLASGSADKTGRVWDVETGESVLLRADAEIYAVAFTPGGDQVISGSSTGGIQVWDARGDLMVTDLDHHQRVITAVAFQPRGDLALTASADGQLIVWDSLSAEPLRSLRGHDSGIIDADFSPDGRWIFSASDKLVRRWDARTGSLESIYRHDDRITSLAVTLDSSRLITTASDENIRIFDVTSTELLKTLRSPRAMDEVICHPDGERFATSGRELLVWRFDADEPVARMSYKRTVSAIAFNPHQDTIVGVTANHDAVLWGLQTGAYLARKKSHRNSKANDIAFSSEDDRFITGGSDETVHLRNAEDCETVLILEWPGEPVRKVAFSEDGSRIMAGSANGRVRIWETALKEERRQRWLETRRLREQIEPLVVELFDRLFLLKDVRLAIQEDENLDPSARQIALRLAQIRGDAPGPLSLKSLEDARPEGQPAAVYETALERAMIASEMPEAEDDPLSHLARGVAQYRAGLFDEAVASLIKCGRKNARAEGAGEFPELSKTDAALRLLFLCMAQYGGGSPDKAQDTFAIVQRDIEESVELSFSPETGQILEEARGLVHPADG